MEDLERACNSLLLSPVAKAVKNTVLRVGNFKETSSQGSNGAETRACYTMHKSHEGTVLRRVCLAWYIPSTLHASE